MDKRIRRNEVCVIGLPRCDFVLSSTRTCFIAYGFAESPLEMTILRRILEERGIHSVEAGGALAPAQNALLREDLFQDHYRSILRDALE